MAKKPTPPTEKQWKDLYEVALRIKEQAPWRELYDQDLFTILLPNRTEPVCISVMGHADMSYGITVYPDLKSMVGFYRVAEGGLDSPVHPLSYLNCLTCYFGSRNELMPKDREIIKSLGLKFHGDNNWIYFRAMRPGFLPWLIDKNDAEILIQALQNFYMAFHHYSKSGLEIDFEARETMLRYYSKEDDMWLNGVGVLGDPPTLTGTITFEDELLLQRLKKAKKTTTQLELDVIYIDAPVQEKKTEAPYLPRLFAAFDHKTGMSVANEIFDPSFDAGNIVMEFLVSYITEVGKPAKLFVRDKYFLPYVEPLCEQVGIPLMHSKKMPHIDNLQALTSGMRGDWA